MKKPKINLISIALIGALSYLPINCTSLKSEENNVVISEETYNSLVNEAYKKAKNSCEKFLKDYKKTGFDLEIAVETARDWRDLANLQERIRNPMYHETLEETSRRNKLRDKLREQGEFEWGDPFKTREISYAEWWAKKAKESQKKCDEAINKYTKTGKNLIQSYDNLIKILESSEGQIIRE